MSGSMFSWIVPAAHAESGGNPNAQSPTSSASGLLGFTGPTWQSVVQKYGQKYGLTLDGKNDPHQQEKAAQALTENEYRPFFSQRAVTDPSDAQMASLHFWGAPTYAKLWDANPDAPLSSVVSPDVISANKGLLDPSMTVGQAMAKVDGRIPGANVVGTKPAVATPSDDQGAPAASPAGPDLSKFGTPDLLSPAAMAQQTPGNTGLDLFSGPNLLRLAAGLAGGRTLNESIGNAANLLSQGIDRQNVLDLANRKENFAERSGVIDSAAKLMEMGVQPNLALGIASGQINGDAARQALGNVQLGGKSTAGDVFRDPTTGVTYQERNRPYGPPVFYNTATGETSNTLPKGAMRAQDAYFKTLGTGGAAAENAAYDLADKAHDQIATYDQALSLLPHVNAGGNIRQMMSRNVQNLFGGDQQAANNYMDKLFAQMNTDRIAMMHGLGRLDLPIVQNVIKAGANWEQDPAAVRAILQFQRLKAQRSIDVVKDFRAAQKNGNAGDFRSFKMDWEDQHPIKDDLSKVTDELLGGSSGTSSAPADTGTSAAPSGDRPSLDSIFK